MVQLTDNCTETISQQGVFAMARETISDLFSTFCIWLVTPILTISLLYFLVKSEEPLLLITLPILAVVFLIKKQIIKTNMPQS